MNSITWMTSIVLAVGSGASAMAQECIPIRFARGASSGTVSGMASSEESSPCYTIATGREQTARVHLVRKGPDTAFTIPGVVDNRDFTFKTEARTYIINVYQTFRRSGRGPFTLGVSVR